MGSIARFLLHLVADLVDMLSAIIGALAMRWLLNYSTPQQDWLAFCQFFERMLALFIVPDPLEHINMAYLVRLREIERLGGFADDGGRKQQPIHEIREGGGESGAQSGDEGKNGTT